MNPNQHKQFLQEFANYCKLHNIEQAVIIFETTDGFTGVSQFASDKENVNPVYTEIHGMLNSMIQEEKAGQPDEYYLLNKN